MSMTNISKLLSLINGVPRTVDFSNSANILTLAGGLDLSGSLELNGSTSGYVILNASATTSTYSLTMPATQAPSAGYVLSNDGTGQLSWTNPSSGSVTSVALSLPSSIFSVSGSPVTSSGTLTGTLATQAANSIWAGPTSGSAAAPTFRGLVSADIPNNAANTTGTAANVTATSNATLVTLSALSLPATQLTGTIQASQFPALTGDVTTTAGSLVTSLVATSNATLATLSALTAASSLASVGTITSGTWAGTTIAIAHGGTGQTTAAAAYNALSPMTTTGDIEYEASANTAARLAIGTTGQVLTVSGGVPTWAAPATSGTVTSVAFADASTTPIYSISGSPVTSSGTLTQTLATQAANSVFAGPSSGSASQPGFRSLVAGDIPDLSATYVLDSRIGAASGVASLDSGGKVPVSQLPNGVFVYQGLYNPSTNSPSLADGTGTQGQVYYISTAYTGVVAGAFGGASLVFSIGDLAIYNGTAWELTTPAAGVSSVNSAYGAVMLSMASANGFAGSYSGTALTVSTTVTGILQGNGTAVSAASTTGTGNVVLSASPTLTGTITAAAANFSGAISASNFSGSSSGTNTGDVTIGTANGLTLAGQVISMALSSGSTTGALDAADWNTFNNKQAALTFGNFTDSSASADGITVTGGTGAVIGSGTSIVQAKASASQNGYLASADWSTFNSKLTSVLASANIFVGNGSNVATAVAVSGDVTITNAGVVTIGAGAVTASKLATVTDGVTLDQSGAGGTLEIKAAGVSATQLATGAFDQVTILGGAGTPAYVASAPTNVQMFTAGQAFAANTSYAVRMMIPTDSGYVAGRVIAADQNANTTDMFWVVGVAFSAAGVSAGSSIAVISLGSYTLGSSDTAFASGNVGKPVYLNAAGAFSTTAPTTSGYANFKIGTVETVSSMYIALQMMGVA